MERRDKKEIEKDVNRIQKAAETAISMKEVEDKTGLTYSKVRTSLNKHPMIYKRVSEKLSNNKKIKGLEAKLLKEKKAQVRKKIKSGKKGECREHEKGQKKMVIDASICSLSNLEEILNNYANVIITSITLEKLNRIQHFQDVSAAGARFIMDEAAKNPKKYEIIEIKKSCRGANDSIIQFCSSRKDEVVLVTSDKNMSLEARLIRIETIYYSKKDYNDVTHGKKNSHKNNIMTLYPAKRANGKLIINEFEVDNIVIQVSSRGREYNNGPRELNIGDNIYIGVKKEQYITFIHYKMISLSDKNNCRLIYSRRIFNSHSICGVSNHSYRRFINYLLLKWDA